MKRVWFLLFLVVISGCTRGLSHAQAKHIIDSNPLVRPADDHVVVDAISVSSPTEAIVRATIASETVNLKFRNYDTGWTWEFVETKGGGWISPDVGVGQIREVNRQRRIVQWVTTNEAAYNKTIEALNKYSEGLPHRLNVPFTVSEWLSDRSAVYKAVLPIIEEELRKLRRAPTDAKVVKELERLEQQRKRVQGLLAASTVSAADAWGSELLMNFDVGDHEAIFLSLGPDKQKGTDDDVVCMAKGRKEVYELGNGELVWNYDLSWVVPEGLDAVVSPHVTKTFGSVQYAKLLKP